MRLPRNLSAQELIKALGKIGYEVTRQKGSHIRVTSNFPTQHHVTIPNHDPLKIGTLSAILNDIAQARNATKEQIARELFG
ncbi:MAG: type II toxin-antitoxin system HicA family toxin [Cyclobacteriaceae bacterium]